MKKILGSLVMVVLMIAVFASTSSALEVQRAYGKVTHAVNYTNPAFNSKDIHVNGRLKAEVAGGVGFNVAGDYRTSSVFKTSPVSVGLFYQKGLWEFAFDTTFPLNDFGKVGKTGMATLGYGFGL